SSDLIGERQKRKRAEPHQHGDQADGRTPEVGLEPGCAQSPEATCSEPGHQGDRGEEVPEEGNLQRRELCCRFADADVHQREAESSGRHVEGSRNRRAGPRDTWRKAVRSEEHTSELQSREKLVCRLLLEKKKERERAGL